VGQSPYKRIQDIFEQKDIGKFIKDSIPLLPDGVPEIVSPMCAYKPDARYDDLHEVIEFLDIIS